MDANQLIKQKQIAWATKRGLTLRKGSPDSHELPLYTQSLNDNLFEPLCKEAIEEFEGGDGQPMGQRGRCLPKMWALHNSDAIAANVFHYWRMRNPSIIAEAVGLPAKGITSMHFERKFRILAQGTRPNIDVAIRYETSGECLWAGVESKFTETYPAKFNKTFAEKYFQSDEWWDGIPKTQALAKSFRGDGKQAEPFKRHLDRGQLIKHLLGLRQTCRHASQDPSKVRLIYLWYGVDNDEGLRHQLEVDEFAAVLESDGIQFGSRTWQALIGKLSLRTASEHPGYVKYLNERYL